MLCRRGATRFCGMTSTVHSRGRESPLLAPMRICIPVRAWLVVRRGRRTLVVKCAREEYRGSITCSAVVCGSRFAVMRPWLPTNMSPFSECGALPFLAGGDYECVIRFHDSGFLPASSPAIRRRISESGIIGSRVRIRLAFASRCNRALFALPVLCFARSFPCFFRLTSSSFTTHPPYYMGHVVSPGVTAATCRGRARPSTVAQYVTYRYDDCVCRSSRATLVRGARSRYPDCTSLVRQLSDGAVLRDPVG